MDLEVNHGSDDYLDFLPPILSRWGNKIHEISKADTSMICLSLLGALSSAGCQLVNEKRYIAPDGSYLSGPTGLSIIIIAGSGALKSTTKRMAYQPIEDVINQRMPDYKKALAKFKNKPPNKKTLFDEIDAIEEMPVEPVTPNFLQNNVTIEAVINLYNKGMQAMTLLSDEGGTFVGSRAMSKESYINTLSAFNTLLSGDNFSKSTIRGGETLLSGKRLTFMMYMQPQIFDEFLTKCGNISDAGFMQRTLITKAKAADSDLSDDFLADVIDSFFETDLTPKSIYHEPEYIEYKQLITVLLEKPKAVDVYGLLSPNTIEPTPEAKARWFKFYVEQKTLIKESLNTDDETMNSFRERAPETASRIAALFQLADNFGNTKIPITDHNMENAISIVKLSLEEQFRLYEVKDKFFEAVDKMLNWYDRRIEKGLITRMPLRKLIQCAPRALRKKDTILQVLEYLISEGAVEYDSIDYIYLGRKNL